MYRRTRAKTTRSRKAQISMEYLAVVGISLFLIMPMIVIFYQQSSSLEDDINAAQLEKIGLEIIDAAEEAYYLGAPTQKMLNVHLPQGVQTITIYPEEIFFEYNSLQGLSTLSLVSRLPLNMTGTIPIYAGKHVLIIKAQQTTINITESTT